jgi:serine/threonine protein kinase
MKNILENIPDDENSAMNSLYDEAVSHDTPTFLESSLDILNSQDQPYEYKEEIGHGGAKKIMRVYDQRARRYVAMALPRPDKGAKNTESFIRESWITAQLDHPNIINIHEVGISEDGIPFFTMDLKTGDNLEQILHALKQQESDYETRFPQKVLLGFFIKICDATAYAHSINILHLDIKPANIQIGEFGEVIVCDWGLAKFLGGRKTNDLNRDLLEFDLIEKQSPVIKGTPAYMSPEQVLGKKPTAFSDIYSLAALLYHIVTLEPTLPSSGITEAIEKTCLGEIKTPIDISNVSDGLSSIIMKGLSLEPVDRYQTVTQLKNDVVKYLEGYVTNAEDSGLVKEALFFYRRNKTVCLITCSFIIAIIVMTSHFIGNLQKSRSSEQQARVQAEENATKHLQTLELYKKERAQGLEVKKDFSGVLLEQGQLFNNKNFIHNPEIILLQTLKGSQYKYEQNPEDQAIKDKLTITLFLLQRYKEAGSHLGEGNKFHFLQQAIDEALKVPHSYNGRNASLPVFIAALKGLRLFGPASRATSYRALAYDIKTRSHFDGYEEVLRETFMLWNNHWTERTFIYDIQKQFMKISGDNFSELGIHDKFGRIDILKTIPVKHLDVSDSEVKDLTFLYGCPIETLNIRRTFVQNLSPLQNLKSLKKLTVSPKQFSPDKLKQIPKGIELLIEH